MANETQAHLQGGLGLLRELLLGMVTPQQQTKVQQLIATEHPTIRA